jgi:hypothetical protein
MKEIKISTDFSRYPAGRLHPRDGQSTGQRFREEFLVPSLREHPKVVVNLDGALMYPSSFLDEAFGGLVRSEGLRLAELKKKLEIKATEAKFVSYVKAIWDMIESVPTDRTEPVTDAV